MQNKVAKLSRVRPERGSNASKSSQNMAGGTFREVWNGLTNVDQVWPELTKVDRSWLSLTKIWPWPWLGQKQDLINHFLTIEKRTSRPSIQYFTSRKWIRNKGVMGKIVKIGPTLNQIWLSFIDKNKLILGRRSCIESSQLDTSWSKSQEL